MMPGSHRGDDVVLETSRLRLRRFSTADADFILELLNDPSFLEHIGDKGVRTADDARSYLSNGPMKSYEEHGFGLWLVSRQADGAPMGMCGLIKRETLDDVDLGYAFVPRFCGQGYAFEAASAVQSYAHEHLGLHRLVAVVSPENRRSIALLEKLGFTYARRARLAEGEDEIKLYARTRPPG